jgi:hypothetical protein
MEATTPKKEAAIKCRPEKCLAAPRAFPVRQPDGEQEVHEKGQGKEKARDEKGETKFEHCGEEKTEHHEAAAAIGCPGVRILRIHPAAMGFA